MALRFAKITTNIARVIDDDLGRSGSGCIERRGFERLLSEVCQGQAGAVFAIEASRLARNGHDWHRLLEFCQIVDTLIVDHDGVYDPKHPNDRLILELKGTMSEVELSMFRQRSREAIRQQAQRGEYFTRVAEGYVLGEGGRLEKDPDESEALKLTVADVTRDGLLRLSSATRWPANGAPSRHTQASYASSFQLLFEFASKRLKVWPSALTLEQKVSDTGDGLRPSRSVAAFWRGIKRSTRASPRRPQPSSSLCIPYWDTTILSAVLMEILQFELLALRPTPYAASLLFFGISSST